MRESKEFIYLFDLIENLLNIVIFSYSFESSYVIFSGCSSIGRMSVLGIDDVSSILASPIDLF